MSARPFPTLVRRWAAQTSLRVGSRLVRSDLAPWALVRAARAIGGAGSLEPASRTVDSRVLGPPLDTYLSGVELGTWAFGPKTLEHLISLVHRLEPELVIEFGSGASTVALAWAMTRHAPTKAHPSVIAIEQDPAFAGTTRSLLERSSLSQDAAVVVAPIREQTIEGHRTSCYDLSAGLSELIANRRAGLIVIDGPAGRPGIRFGTLPLIKKILLLTAQCSFWTMRCVTVSWMLPGAGIGLTSSM